MAETCVACGGEVHEGDAKCPSCGLVFVAPGSVQPIAPAPAPNHVNLYLGSVPSTVAESQDTGDAALPDEFVDPTAAIVRPSLTPQQVRRRILFWTLAAAVAAALVVVLVRTHRPNDAWTQQERAFERFEDADALRPVEIPADFDPEARIAEDGRTEPDALRAAAVGHVPLVRAPGQSLHDVFAAFRERLVAISPDWALEFGVHPHPATVTGLDAETGFRWMLLVRDLWQVLHDWPDVASLSPHDRADREALLGWAELGLRWRSAGGDDVLATMQQAGDPLLRLSVVECCPPGDRIDAAAARLSALPVQLRSALGRLPRPSRQAVLATVGALLGLDDDLAEYPKRFRGSTPEERDRLRAPLSEARAAIADCARTLRTKVLADADAPFGVGAWNAALVLRTLHRVPRDLRDVYGEALAALREAHDELRELQPAVSASRETIERGMDEDQIEELRGKSGSWATDLPADGGVRLRRMPSSLARGGARAVYMDDDRDEPGTVGIVLVADPPPPRDGIAGEMDALTQHHVLAHESYPGHRMESLLRRSACALRRFVDDRLFVEGWAKAAEDLLHETGACSGGPKDAYGRAWERAGSAENALVEILIETRAAPEDTILALLMTAGFPHPESADLGLRAATPLYALNYSVGRAEIRRLREMEERRLGAAFDLRAFHTKLLREGPIPPRLIEAEWRAATR